MDKTGVAQYWERRYRAGGNSGAGSRGHLLDFKARMINDFITKNNIQSVIDFGCGDGYLAEQIGACDYLGFDVSKCAVRLCRNRMKDHPTKSFFSTRAYAGEMSDVALSIDVIFHLVEEALFDVYMGRLFFAAKHFVVIYVFDEWVLLSIIDINKIALIFFMFRFRLVRH